MESLHDAERQAAETLGEELKDHLSACMHSVDVIAMAVQEAPEVPERKVSRARHAATSLMVRLCNDLRCAALLASRGYAMQAASLVSCAYEVSFAVAAIADDENAARRWIEHADPVHSFDSVLELTRKGLQNLKAPDFEAQVDRDYRTFRQLCWAKHANPLLQQEVGFFADEHAIYAMNGPDCSEQAVRITWFAMDYACRLAYIALASFISNHLPYDACTSVVEAAHKIGESRHSLQARAIERWGSEDPFPENKW